MITIGLWQPKNIINVGCVLRAAYCFNADLIMVYGERYKKAPTDTYNAYKKIPIISINPNNFIESLPFGCTTVAVELLDHADNIISYRHVKSGFYLFGPEDGSIPDNILTLCQDKIYIPTNQCLNLAATVNVVLYDRLLKESIM